MLLSILRNPGARALPESTGEAIARFRQDVEAVANFVMQTLHLAISIVMGFVALGIMLRVSVYITLTVFFPLMASMGLLHLATGRIHGLRLASRKATGEVTGFLGEIFGSIQAIQVANAESRVMGHFKALNDLRRKAEVKDQVFGSVLGSAFANLSTLGMGMVLILSGQAMQKGAFTLGDFVLFQFYMGWLMNIPTSFGNLFQQYKQLAVSFDRLIGLLPVGEGKRLVEHGATHLTGPLPEVPFPVKVEADFLHELKAHGLTFRYPESGGGIENAGVELKRGSFTVVTGRIGSGKTTFLRVLLGLLPMDKGEIFWNGNRVNDPADFLVPPRSAYTPQLPRLYSESLKDNILMGLPEDRVDIQFALQSAVLERDVATLEKGIDTPVGPRGVKLSGGQMQRAAAARMFVRDPEVLVFDDLSSALDVETERLMWDRLFRDKKDVTCLVVSHRRAALRWADHIIVLKNGFVDAEGKLEDLLEKSEEMRCLWRGDEGTNYLDTADA